MATRRFHVLIEWDPDDKVWVTYVPALGHLSTYGDTREEALEQTREAVIGYLEAAAKEHLPIPDESASDVVEIGGGRLLSRLRRVSGDLTPATL